MIKSIIEKELISEEMRLIYVALTRAKEQLILIGSVDKEETLAKFERFPITNQRIALHKRLSVAKPFDLIYGILAKHQSTSLVPELQFETSIDNLDDSLYPSVDIKTVYFDDLTFKNEASKK